MFSEIKYDTTEVENCTKDSDFEKFILSAEVDMAQVDKRVLRVLKVLGIEKVSFYRGTLFFDDTPSYEVTYLLSEHHYCYTLMKEFQEMMRDEYENL